MPINVRLAKKCDMEDLLSLCRDFRNESKMYKGGEFKDETAKKVLSWLIQSNKDGANAVLLVSEIIPDVIDSSTPPSKICGMIAMMASPDLWNDSVLVSQELFWYARNGTGINLLNRAREWAVDKGCSHWLMAERLNDGVLDERIHKVYNRFGLSPVERFYRGKL